MTTLLRSIEHQGSFLFRWRSYVPLPLLGIFVVWMFAYSPASAGDAGHRLWELLSIGVGALGLAIRACVGGHVPGGTSGRNTRHQAADWLNRCGLYSVVRHPLYLGNFLLWMGVAMFTRSAVLVALAAALFALVYERIMAAEERFLLERFGDAYAEWASRTPAIIPRFRLWQTPTLPFSWRSAARKEYSAMFGFIAALGVLELAASVRQGGSPGLGTAWTIALVSGMLAYLILRTLKRRTRVLHVAGR